jgi:DNA-binding SARP family transcriptional activator
MGEDLPVNARRSVQTLVTRLRRALGRDVICTMPEGYRLDADPDRIDVLRFRRLLAEAGRARDTAAERALVGEALALWRGAPYEGIDSDWLRASESAYLLESYLNAVERRIDLDLAVGRHGELVAELMELAGYERLRRRLADELGTDPSGELRRIHASLLRAETPPDHLVPKASGQMSQRVAVFEGLTADLAQADQLLEEGTGERFTKVCVLSGTTGGKSFLALVWTHL